MTLYVESNFLLALVLQQEEHLFCESLLEHCAAGRARLAVPAFALVEPEWTLQHRHGKRKQALHLLGSELRELRRSTAYVESQDAMIAATSLLARSIDEQREIFRHVTKRLNATAQVIPTSATIVRAAHEFDERFQLGLQDGIVLASILEDLQTARPEWSCFASTDTGFEDPEVQSLLAQYGCKLLFRFEHCWNYVRSRP